MLRSSLPLETSVSFVLCNGLSVGHSIFKVIQEKIERISCVTASCEMFVRCVCCGLGFACCGRQQVRQRGALSCPLPEHVLFSALPPVGRSASCFCRRPLPTGASSLAAPGLGVTCLPPPPALPLSAVRVHHALCLGEVLGTGHTGCSHASPRGTAPRCGGVQSACQ